MLSSLTPKKLFLIDGIGAIISAFFLGIILVLFESIIGMPLNVLYALAASALLFACYSLSCHFLSPSKWQLYLKLIAAVNTFYCFLTLGLVTYYYTSLTMLGLVYFLIEIVIIALLIRTEFLFAQKKS